MSNKKRNEALAEDIYDWCFERDLWFDCVVYFNGKAWATFSKWNGADGKRIDDNLYEYDNKNPRDYFDYCNPDTLSMSFEGNLYEVLNYYYDIGCTDWYEQFYELFEKHGYFFELGNSWNLSACEM